MKKALKILAIALLLFATVAPLQAQTRRVLTYLPQYEQAPYHFGFLLAFNKMMYTVKAVDNYQNQLQAADSWPTMQWPTDLFKQTETRGIYVYNIETQQVPGFTVGIIGSKRLGRYFDLRLIPSLSFSERRLDYTILLVGNNGATYLHRFTKPIFSTFVEFPLNIKYRSKRYNNIGAYVFGGVNPKLDLASQKNNKEIDPEGNEYINNLVTKRFDCAAELGAGFDIYNQWFKMGLEVKMSYGMLGIVKDNGNRFIYSAPIDQLRNKMFQVSVLIE